MDTLELFRPDRLVLPVPGVPSLRPASAALGGVPLGRPVLDVVVPVYNEERDLGPCVRRLRRYLDESMPWSAIVTIADNASTDATWSVATTLAGELEGVRAVHLAEKGRGRALRAAWSSSDAQVLAYTDVDLSTDLKALLPLVAPLVSGHSDLSIGSRLARGAQVRRGPKRELISRCYNAILRVALHSRFSDAQCGFKAICADEARALLPALLDEGWFFDTELLVLAERNDLRIHEVPVDWSDDPDSRVQIVSAAVADLRGVWRMLSARAAGRDRVAGLPERFHPALAERRGRTGTGPLGLLVVVALWLVLRLGIGELPALIVALTVLVARSPATWAWRSVHRGAPELQSRRGAVGSSSSSPGHR
jgi:hypothetical protein